MADHIQVVGYASWASHLINGDPSGLTDDEFAELQTWLQFNGFHDFDCLDCTRESFFANPGHPGALMGDCLTYFFCAE